MSESSSLQFDAAPASARPIRPLPAPPAALGHAAKRIEHLIVCRESSQYDHLLMEGMVQQTLASCSHLPTTTKAMELGIIPLTDMSSVVPPLNATQLRTGSAVAVLFELDSIYHLYSMSSAASSNSEGDNDFSQLLIDVLRSLRPRNLYVANLSRLVRSFEHGALVQSAVTKYVDQVHAGGTKLAMSGGEKSHGNLMFMAQTMVAAAERDAIIQRLTAGTVAKYRRGEWIHGRRCVPAGYKLDRANRRLTPNEEELKVVQTAFALMADPGVPDRRVIQRLADLGASTESLRRRFGADATVAQMANIGHYLGRFIDFGDFYLTGRFETRLRNPFPGVQHLAGLSIDYGNRAEGELVFEYQFERLDLNPDLILAARAVRSSSRRPTGAAAKKRRPPLNGFVWNEGDFEVRIMGRDADTYVVRAIRAAG